jgi:prolyl-tRNA synthetase
LRWKRAGVDTILDDRPVSAGVVFSEADLIGAPIRATVSPRNLKDGMIELTTRDKRVKKQVPLAEALNAILALRSELSAKSTQPFDSTEISFQRALPL